ncbi:MAG: hypothetical protein LBB12_03300, partial [Holosporaceae bacterium]|nr:hypothetical protein [Holosporaceae bacterium]
MKKELTFLRDITILLLTLCLFDNADCINSSKLKQGGKLTSTTSNASKGSKVLPATSLELVLKNLTPYTVDINNTSSADAENVEEAYDKSKIRQKIVTLLAHLMVEACDFIKSSNNEEVENFLISLILQINPINYDLLAGTLETHSPGALNHEILLNETSNILMSKGA